MIQASEQSEQVTDTTISAAALEPIAIIGIGCRFPGGANTPESFWRNLCAGVDAIVEIPPDRWSLDEFYDPDRSKPGKLNTRCAGLLERVDQFDAQFFGISPREAAQLDPQQRMLLEVCWEALENGGQIPDQLAGSLTGVFIGGFTMDYFALSFSESNRPTLSAHSATGTMMTLLANRISHAFDFRGPSIALDTACSSSLVAVHLACQSLWDGDSTLAVAGGSNAIFKPEYTIAESKAGMLSPDGRCKTFDIRANGYVRGEGVGIVVLKRLAQARADGDPIYAIIRGTAVNQDGHTNGITVPSGAAQEAAIRSAYRRAGITPASVQYVEAHGTGTPVGDPIEANALGKVLSEGRPTGSPCIVGSVKTNIGHLEAAAGVAGLIKAALCLKNRAIPPNLHFHTPNPRIDFAALNLQVAQTVMPWPSCDGPARASVNSFGFGGTNAHAILEEAPVTVPITADLTPITADLTPNDTAYLLPLSARSPDALIDRARTYHSYLTSTESASRPSLRDIGYTSSLRRSHHEHRLALVARSTDELIEQLDAFSNGDTRSGMSSGRRSSNRNGFRPVFVFSGMGPQWWAMGRQLMQEEPVFRAVIERCDELFTRHSGWSLLQEMLADEADSHMNETRVSQPANFALQLGLVALWRSWGIEPAAIIGHSAGEVAAVHAAGGLNLEDAVRLIYHRSRLQHQTTGMGKMLAVGLPHAEATKLIADYSEQVSIAAINSPSSVTLVGDPDSLAAIAEPLQQQGVFCRYLQGKVPYHSHYMNPLKDELLTVLDGLQATTASVPLYSTVTGGRIDGCELTAPHWWRNVRNPVLFAAAIEQLIRDGYTTFVELSPHPVLASSISEGLANQKQTGLVVSSLRRNEPERATILAALGALYTQDAPVNWQTLYASGGNIVTLPSYPWQHERYWNETELSAQDRLGYKVHPLLGRQVPAPIPTWQVELNPRLVSYLDDHRIQGTVVYPGAAYAETALSAAQQAFGVAADLLETQIEFRKALFLAEGETPTLRVTLDPSDATFTIHSQSIANPNSWTLHAAGRMFPRQAFTTPRPLDIDEVRERCGTALSSTACYQQFRNFGLEYGPTFQGVQQLWQGNNEALAQVEITSGIRSDLAPYQIHPAILDLCFQVLAAVLPFAPEGAENEGMVYMPVGVEHGSRVPGTFTDTLYIHATLTEQNASMLRGDIRLYDDTGKPLMEIIGCRATALERSQGAVAARPPEIYELAWEAQAREPAEPPSGSGSWLIFADQSQIGRSTAALLEEHGERCVLVYPGSKFAVLTDDKVFQINPAQLEDMQRLFVAVGNDSVARWRGIIHLWGLDTPSLAETSVTTLETATDQGSITVLHTLQTMIQTEAFSGAKLWIATRGAAPVALGTAELAVAQAPLWGLSRVLGHQEHPNLWGGIIDLDPTVRIGAASTLFNEIWFSDGEDQVALRAGERYVARVRVREPATPPVSPTFRTDGSYLITGGLGGLGLLMARWMAENGARRLILLGREPLPPRVTWPQLPSDSTVGERVAAVQELERMGVSVQVATVDITNEAQLSAFITNYRAEGWPPICGVIHAAGVATPQLLAQMDVSAFKRVMYPKVQGAWLLHTLLTNEPLDFFVLFSSVASTVAIAGQGNYAAANAFMDALAHLRSAQGRPGLSINWGPWGEVGMATKLDLIDHFERRGLFPMTSAHGIQAMERVMGQVYPQLTIVGVDWPLFGQWYPKGISPRLVRDLTAPPTNTETGDESTTTQTGDIVTQILAIADETERRAALQQQIHTIVARVMRLNLNRCDPDQPLNSLGLDSMIAIELKNQLEHDLRVTVTVVELLQGTSVSNLTTKLLPQLQPAASPEADDSTTTDLLAELDQLSPDEVAALLSEINAEVEEVRA